MISQELIKTENKLLVTFILFQDEKRLTELIFAGLFVVWRVLSAPPCFLLIRKLKLVLKTYKLQWTIGLTSIAALKISRSPILGKSSFTSDVSKLQTCSILMLCSVEISKIETDKKAMKL